ncbi:MAG: hypothetical protein J0H78_12970 [Rhizobiales bacterium]|nr:hypothetical protein [Hyphomicrobiales bacterium]
MSNDLEAQRQKAREDFSRDQQAQMATEQSIRDADERNARNAELSRLRAEADSKK